MNKKISVICIAIALRFSQVVIASNLVVNGSFEAPDVPSTPAHVDLTLGGWFNAPIGAGIPGWQAVGGAVSVIRTPYNEGYETILSAEGAQSVDLTAES